MSITLHTSIKIQFQYPTSWVQSEKISSHDRGPDISVSKGGSGSVFWITLENDTRIGSNLQAGLRHVMKMLNESNAQNGYEITQPPSFATIDGQMAETFTSYSRHGFGAEKLEIIEQYWLTYGESADYYFVGFIAPIQSFDNPENIMVRNQFISSIKILDAAELAKFEAD